MSEYEHPKGKGAWYFVSTWYCPICSATTVYKERRHTPKPEAWEDRHEVEEAYDYCNAL